MFVIRAVYKAAVKRARTAEAKCLRLEAALERERERNRVREEALVDRVLTKSNSRPVTPEEPPKPVQRPLSKIEVDRLQDMMKEELEHRNLNPDEITPDVRNQLDDILDDLMKEARPFQ